MINHRVHKIFITPPREIIKKVFNKLHTITATALLRSRDLRISTYTFVHPTGRICTYLSKLSAELLSGKTDTIVNVANNYLAHRFDLLGSGWVQVKHGINCRGIEGRKYDMGKPIQSDPEGLWLVGRINESNLKESQRIWQLIFKAKKPFLDLQSLILKTKYIPIDWHLDFKSGYRWSESTWYKDIRYGDMPGVDIKIPWELARMQHLPMLAWAYALACQSNTGFRPANVYAFEFRNQILDFIATNPPRYGVNWRGTMDVAIRVANWLIAYDIFRAFGAEFDEEFENVFSQSVYDHGKHCLNNLDYSHELRSNHYLSDIAGLLFAAAYLQETPETNRWLAFAFQEIVSEMNHEFQPDGTNFEASTSYHRLSTEIILYSAIFSLLVPRQRKQALKNYNPKMNGVVPKLNSYNKQSFNVDSWKLFPDFFWERLERAVEFTRDITKPNGEIPQFGDNDSGRFLKIWPLYEVMPLREAVARYRNLADYESPSTEILNDQYLDEKILDHSHLMSVGGILFKRTDFLSACPMTPEVALINAALCDNAIASYRGDSERNSFSAAFMTIQHGDRRDLDDWISKLMQKYEEPYLAKISIQQIGAPLTKDLTLYAYPNFGLYLYRSPQLYLAIRCGSIGQKGNGGHAHNDQLGIEINFEGIDVIRDPGSYIYTPFFERRNQFRSTLAHFVPQYRGQEQNIFRPGLQGLFNLQGKEPGECHHFSPYGFVGEHRGFKHSVFRIIQIADNHILIYDFGSDSHSKLPGVYSNGYGKWLNDSFINFPDPPYFIEHIHTNANEKQT